MKLSIWNANDDLEELFACPNKRDKQTGEKENKKEPVPVSADHC